MYQNQNNLKQKQIFKRTQRKNKMSSKCMTPDEFFDELNIILGNDDGYIEQLENIIILKESVINIKNDKEYYKQKYIEEKKDNRRLLTIELENILLKQKLEELKKNMKL